MTDLSMTTARQRARTTARVTCGRVTRGVACAGALLGIALGGLAIPGPALAAGSDASGYDPGRVVSSPPEVTTYYEVTNTDDGSQLWSGKVSDDGSTMSHAAIGSPVPTEYNAITFDNRAKHGALYGATLVPGGDEGNASRIVQIDTATGQVRDLGVEFWLDHASGARGSSITAAMDDEGAIYFGTHNSPDLVVFDVDTGGLQHLTFSEPLRVSDTTWAQGYLWGRENRYGDLVRIDPETRTVTTYPSPSWMPQGDEDVDDGVTGGMFTFSNGNLGFIFNGGATQYGTGGVTQQVDLGDPDHPSFALVATYGSPSARGTDGAVGVGQVPVDLSLQKDAGGDEYVVGERVPWTIRVTNAGPGESSGYVVRDEVPAALTDVTLVSGEGVTIEGNTVTIQSGVLPAGASRVYEFSTRAQAAGSVTNTATVEGNEVERTLADNTDGDTVRVVDRAPGFTVAKTDDRPHRVVVGDVITYTITAENTGNTVLEDVALRDDLAEVWEHAPMVAGTVSASRGDAPTIEGQTLTWNGTLRPGETVVVTYAVRVSDDAAGGLIRNAVVATSETPSPCETGAEEGCHTEHVVVEPAPAAPTPTPTSTPTPTPTPSVSPTATASPSPSPAPASRTVKSAGAALAETGGDESLTTSAFAAGAVLLLGGSTLALSARRRRHRTE